jgi:hypothetical protein
LTILITSHGFLKAIYRYGALRAQELIMKAVIAILALCSISALAMAEDASIQPVEHYNYSMHLDIAKVISSDAIPDNCKVVPLHMVYEDSQGKQHTMEYLAMGNGCTN